MIANNCADFPGGSLSTFFGSKVTDQLTGLEDSGLMSRSSEVPVFVSLSSTCLVSPAVISVLNNPDGVVRSMLHEPVIETSNSNSADDAFVTALTGILYLPASTLSGDLISMLMVVELFGSVVTALIV